MKTAQAASIRLMPEAKRVLVLMAENLSLSQTTILELAIREKAKGEGVK